MTTVDIFDPDYLASELTGLSEKQLLAFAASCCERPLPFYNEFHKTERWGDPALVRTTLDEIWQIAQGKLVDVREIQILRRKCVRVAPDADKFFSNYTSRALHVCEALHDALEACLQPSARRVGLVRLHVLEALDVTINKLLDQQEPHLIMEARSPEVIDNHPLMIQELSKQRHDIQILRDCTFFDKEFVETFRVEAIQNNLPSL
jgi:uncharacterized protein